MASLSSSLSLASSPLVSNQNKNVSETSKPSTITPSDGKEEQTKKLSSNSGLHLSKPEDKHTDKQFRLTQYMDFVKLYTEVHKGMTAKKDANLVWKEKIQKENTENLSMGDYMEQLALLKTKKNLQNLKIESQYDSGVEFTCAGADKSVKVAGTFNNWIPQSLDYDNDGDFWAKYFNIPPGCYTYKYVVDGVWLHDPSKETADDGTGNINNVVHVEDKFTSKLRQLREEITDLRKQLEKPWFVEQTSYKLCPLVD